MQPSHACVKSPFTPSCSDPLQLFPKRPTCCTTRVESRPGSGNKLRNLVSKDQGLSVPHRHLAHSNLPLLLASTINREHDDSGEPNNRDGVVLILSASTITSLISGSKMWQVYPPAHSFLDHPSLQSEITACTS